MVLPHSHMCTSMCVCNSQLLSFETSGRPQPAVTPNVQVDIGPHSSRGGIPRSLLYPSPRLSAAGEVWPLHTAHKEASGARYSDPYLTRQQQMRRGRCARHATLCLVTWHVLTSLRHVLPSLKTFVQGLRASSLTAPQASQLRQSHLFDRALPLGGLTAPWDC